MTRDGEGGVSEPGERTRVQPTRGTTDAAEALRESTPKEWPRKGQNYCSNAMLSNASHRGVADGVGGRERNVCCQFIPDGVMILDRILAEWFEKLIKRRGG